MVKANAGSRTRARSQAGATRPSHRNTDAAECHRSETAFRGRTSIRLSCLMRIQSDAIARKQWTTGRVFSDQRCA